MENGNDPNLTCTCGLDSQHNLYKNNGKMEMNNEEKTIEISKDKNLESGLTNSDILEVEESSSNAPHKISDVKNLESNTPCEVINKTDEKSDVDTDSLESFSISSTEVNTKDIKESANNSEVLNGTLEQDFSLKSPSPSSVMSDSTLFGVSYDNEKPNQNKLFNTSKTWTKSALKSEDGKISKKISRTQTLDLNLLKSKTNSNFEKHKILNKCLSPSDRRKSTSAILQTSSESHGIRETRLSRTRFEKCHEMHDRAECEGDDYLTPTQRKDLLLKNLKKEVSELKRLISEKNEELQMQKQSFEKELEIALAEKGTEIVILKSEIETLEKQNEDLQNSYQMSINTVNMLEDNIRELKELIATKEKNNEKIFLETYRKGQMSALFERNQELERMAVSCDGSSLTIKELLQKLLLTETELGKWQSIRRQESYDSATKPETEAEATLRFLKDSFYHYTTDSKDCDFHLRAIIRILNFTDVQKKKIADCIVAKRKNKQTI